MAKAIQTHTTAKAVAHVLVHNHSEGDLFTITARVSAIMAKRPDGHNDALSTLAVALEDDSGAVVVQSDPRRQLEIPNLTVGDSIEVSGCIKRIVSYDLFGPIIDSVTRISHAEPTPPLKVTADEIANGSCDYRNCVISGTLRDAADSGSCTGWAILKLTCDAEFIDASIPCSNGEIDELRKMIGSTISLIGVVMPFDNSLRTKMGRIFVCWSKSAISCLSPLVKDPFDVPEITALDGVHPSKIIRKGRHKAVGRVLASWQGNNLLLLLPNGELSKVELSQQVLPSCDETIEAIGFPESDLYHINLVSAQWRKTTASKSSNHQREPIPIDKILQRPQQQSPISMSYHGQPVRLSGTLCSLPDPINNNGIMHVISDGTMLTVDVSGTPSANIDLPIGSIVEITGVCVAYTPNWTPNVRCRRSDKFTIVVREANDIKVLSTPSWFTAKRLTFAVIIMAFALSAILLWNRSLKTLADRRGRLLFREQLHQIKSDLRLTERTKLSIELHDSLAQCLTAIAMEIETAQRFWKIDAEEALRHLSAAGTSLKSCRLELRNTLWDLRCQSLDENDMDKAIRRALLPYIKDIDLAIRFHIPRSVLNESNTHEILRIIRELVINGIQHGHARKIKVAGSYDQGHLKFSVTDNGNGFDPSSCPGVQEGHFGLQGIRERLQNLGGKLNIDSSQGNGTRASVSIRISKQDYNA